MTDKQRDALVGYLGNLLLLLLAVGQVWALAWAFDPNIDSGAVWFFGGIYGATLVNTRD